MVEKIRHSVFETNSSSTHSITISNSSSEDLMDLRLYPNENGELVLNGGQFGWEEESYYDAETKANYIAIYIQDCVRDETTKEKFLTIFEKLLKNQTGASSIIYEFENSYIDHQSVEYNNYHYLCEDYEMLKNFIFNRNSELMTDNDNH